MILTLGAGSVSQLGADDRGKTTVAPTCGTLQLSYSICSTYHGSGSSLKGRLSRVFSPQLFLKLPRIYP